MEETGYFVTCLHCHRRWQSACKSCVDKQVDFHQKTLGHTDFDSYPLDKGSGQCEGCD